MILALVLVSAFLHATWNALLRMARDKVVWSISVMVFAEPVTVTSIAGSAVVLAGLVLTSAGAGKGGDTGRGGLGWASSIAAYKAALGAGGSPSAVFAASLGLAAYCTLRAPLCSNAAGSRHLR